MTTATAFAPSPRLAGVLASIAPARIRFDPLGLASGFRAYSIYTYLNARSDAELAMLGIGRADVARVAVEAASDAAR